MTAKEARNHAADYLCDAIYCFYEMKSKQQIDDIGTMSKEGFVDADCDKIQKQLEFFMRKILKAKKTMTAQELSIEKLALTYAREKQSYTEEDMKAFADFISNECTALGLGEWIEDAQSETILTTSDLLIKFKNRNK